MSEAGAPLRLWYGTGGCGGGYKHKRDIAGLVGKAKMHWCEREIQLRAAVSQEGRPSAQG